MPDDFQQLPDTGDAYELYSFVRTQVAELPTPSQFADQVMRQFAQVWKSPVSACIRGQLRQFAIDLYQYE